VNKNYDNIDNNLKKCNFVFTKNCNFTEVGEPFAEQPLAVAVQQGSHLVKLISKTILELQKERYFEQLTSKKKRPLVINYHQHIISSFCTNLLKQKNYKAKM
jgi:hypothetical protein